MIPERRACVLVSIAIVVAATACGGSNGSVAAGPAGTALTVFVPPGPNAPEDFELPPGMTLDYEVGCGETPTDTARAEGTLDFVGSFLGTGPASTAVFEGVVELDPGPCIVELRLREATGELYCTQSEPVSPERETMPSELYVTMGCFAFCPTSPLPDELVGPKLSCGPVGAVVLSVEIPSGVQGVDRVLFAMEESGDRFLGGVSPQTYEGVLERVGSGTADFGEGPTATDVWEAIVREVSASVPQWLELSVFDFDGATLCSAERTVELVPSGVAHVHVLLSCS